jgi:hypothetical protein
MIQPETWKVIREDASRSWSAIGPLIGVFVGAYLSGRRQKRDWLADNKKAEYRELLSAMTKALSTHIFLGSFTGGQSGGQNEKVRLAAATSELMEVTRSRLFIAKQIKRIDIVQRWFVLTDAFQKTRDLTPFSQGTRALLDEIVETALKDIAADEGKGWRLLKFWRRRATS